MHGGTVTVSWVWMVARAAQTYGVSQETLLEEVPFDPQSLHDPEGRVPFRQYLKMFDRAARLTGAPDFGLRAGTFVRPDLHLTTLLVLNAPTLGDVYDRMCRLSRFHWDRSSIRVELDGDRARLITQPPVAKPAFGYRHFIDSRLSIWVNFGRIALNEAWRPLEIRTMVEPGAPAAEREAFFGCPVTVQGDRLELTLDRALFERPTVKQYEPLDEAMQDLSRDMLASLRRQDGFAEQTRRIILSQLPARSGLAASDMAREAGLSLRTFERRLRAEGTTYSRLLEESRVRMACHYFTVRELPLSSIAVLVGYQSQAAFDHAFRRVMNNAPSSVRKAMLEVRETHLPSPATAAASATPQEH